MLRGTGEEEAGPSPRIIRIIIIIMIIIRFNSAEY